jgi:hypothetical protein
MSKSASPKRARLSMLFGAARWIAKEQKNQRKRPSPRWPPGSSGFRAAPRRRGKNRLGRATVSWQGLRTRYRPKNF